MKNRYALWLALALLSHSLTLSAQCLPDGITFSSQAQIDSFPMNYPGCTVIEGDVIIQEDIEGDIVSLDSLYPIEVIEGALEIGKEQYGSAPDGNNSLFDLSGLNNLTALGGLWVANNESLTTFLGLDQLTSIREDLEIVANGSMTSLSGLENLISIGEDLEIYYNGLTSLNGLNSLISIGGDLLIATNHSLNDLSGLENLTSIEGDLVIGGTDYYYAYGNQSLTSLNGLEGLTSIGGSLSILVNEELASLSGLENLISIGEDLDIYYNSSLTSLSGLENLISIGGDLLIAFNDSLSVCHEPWVCDYLENGSNAGFGNNAPGCNTQQEVEDACATVSVDELILEEAIQIFPNPTTGVVQINTPDNSEWNVGIKDAMGRTLIPSHPISKAQLDLSFLEIGLYFIELSNGQQTIIERIVKQ